MNISYDNSMYDPTPKEPLICIPVNPEEEEMEWKIMMRIDEEKYNNGFEDIEAVRNRELIKWEESKNLIMPLKATIMEF